MSNLVDGRYQLIDVIGAGGMATVWRAQDLRLNRMVALKRPRSPLSEPGTGPDGMQPNGAPLDPSALQARMSREMQLAASLSHPNLVTVHDAGHDDSGLYLVMELVEAPSLAEVLARSGHLDRARTLGVGSEIADALAAVHKVGIVHRDVKPGNILLADAGAKLTDFGIASGSSADATVQTSLTVAGSVLGTFNYASPEVLAGDRPTDRSDVYSLASVVYQMVTGRLPFAESGRLGPAPTCGDTALDNVFAAALAHDAWRRPDAATFGARLRSARSSAGPAAPSRPGASVVNPTSPIPISGPLPPSTPTGPDRTAAMPTPPLGAPMGQSSGSTQAMPPHLQPDIRPAARPQPGPAVVGRPLIPNREPSAPPPHWPEGPTGRPAHGGPGRPQRDPSSPKAGGRLAAAAVAVVVAILAGFLVVQALQPGDSVEASGDAVEDGDGNRVDAGEGDDITPQTLPSTTTTTATVEDEPDEDESGEADGQSEGGGEDSGPLGRTLDDLEDALDRADEEFDGSGLPNDEVENLLDRAREAIDSARESDELENVRRLDDLRRQIDEAVGDESEDSPRGRLERLARLLGLSDDESDGEDPSEDSGSGSTTDGDSSGE